jgi:hypothetical protein
MVTRKPDRQGDHGISRKPLRGDAGLLWRPRCEYSCAFFTTPCAHEAAGAPGTRHSPRPLFYGRRIHAPLGRIAPRECRSVCDERATFSVVVPADAVTHNHRRPLKRKPLATTPKRKATAYGFRVRGDDVGGLSATSEAKKARSPARNTLSRHHPRKRVIQYSRGRRNEIEKPRRTGYPAFAGYDDHGVGQARSAPSASKSIDRHPLTSGTSGTRRSNVRSG